MGLSLVLPGDGGFQSTRRATDERDIQYNKKTCSLRTMPLNGLSTRRAESEDFASHDVGDGGDASFVAALSAY